MSEDKNVNNMNGVLYVYKIKKMSQANTYLCSELATFSQIQ